MRHRAVTRLVATVLLTGFVAPEAWGQFFPPWFSILWLPLGPDGGTIRAFVVDPSSPYALAATIDGSLWETSDAGRSWTYGGAITGAIREGGVVTGRSVTALAEGGAVYAATGSQTEWCCFRGGYWFSRGRVTNGEVTQLVASLGEETVGGGAVALVTPTPDTGGFAHLERSTDQGFTWQPVQLPNGALPQQLVRESRLSARLYALTNRGVLLSLDFGVTWASASAGLPQTLVALALAPATPSVLYAFDDESRLYRTMDGGQQWRRRGPPVLAPNPIAPTVVAQLVVDAVDSSTLYMTARQHAGRRMFHTLHRSTDGGLTWQPLGASDRVASGLLASVASSPSTLMVAVPDGGGVVVSEDRGETFVAARGLTGRTIEDLAASPRPPSPLFAAALPQTIATTTDAGQTWTERFTLGPIGPTIRARDVVADPHDPTLVWAVDDLSALKITDAGRRVERIDSQFGFGASRIAVASSVPATLYVVGNESCALQRSTDGGASWSCPGEPPVATPAAKALMADPRDPRIVHLVDGEGRLYSSLDGAESWASVPISFEVTALAVDPLDGATLYAGTEQDGIWKSLDRGSSWLLLGNAANGLPFPQRAVTELLAHPVDPDRLYVSYVGLGVYETVNGGATFHRMGFVRGEVIPSHLGLAHELISGPLAIDPQLPSRVYAGTRGAGVWTAVHHEPAPCVEDDRTLCLGGGRFRVQARWRDFNGRSGPAHAVSLTRDSGYFWFFEPDNLELMVKALDGRTLNERFWIFYGALSNVEFQMVVTDSETGHINAYFNPERQFASRGDTSAFPREQSHAVRAVVNGATKAGSSLAAPRTDAPVRRAEDDALVLGGGRFRVTVEWRDFQGREGVGHPHPLNDTTGTFWFFEPENPELAIKVLDGRALNGRFWVFYGALSNVEYRITVEDTTTGEVRTYFNPSGQFASRGDTAAFPLQ